MKKKNKVPTRLSAQAKLHKTYESVTSKSTIIFPHERRQLNTSPRVRAKYCKKYKVSTEPRGW